MAINIAVLQNTLLNARSEILELRRRNELLSAQMAVVEVFAAALGMKRNEGGMAPDIAYELMKAYDELSKPEATAS